MPSPQTPRARPSRSHPIDLDRQLRALHRAATTIVDELGAIVRRLEHEGSALESDARKWQERLLFLEKRRVPAPVLDRARSIEAEIRAHACPRQGLPRQRAPRAGPRVGSASAHRRRAHADRRAPGRVRSQREQLEQSPLWRLGAAPAEFDLVAAELRATWRVLRDYLCARGHGACRVVLRRPGASRLALHQAVGADAPVGPARLRTTGRRIVAHRPDVARGGSRPTRRGCSTRRCSCWSRFPRRWLRGARSRRRFR